jgi:Mg-chelatase subunit ChlI
MRCGSTTCRPVRCCAVLCCADPYDAELMSEEVRQRLRAGEELPVGSMKIPMVDLPLGATGGLKWFGYICSHLP